MTKKEEIYMDLGRLEGFAVGLCAMAFLIINLL